MPSAAPLLIQAGTSCFMAGLIWTMQLLNYPLLALISPADVPRYEQSHNRRFGLLVIPGVVVTATTSVVMLVTRPAMVPLAVPQTTLVLLAGILISTVRHGARAHTRLAQEFTPSVHAMLVRTNWVRTAAWSALAALDLIAVAHLLPG
jgi:hypothetical protein